MSLLSKEFPEGFTTTARFTSITNLSDAATRLLWFYADFASISQNFLLWVTDDLTVQALRWSQDKVTKYRTELVEAGFLKVRRQGQGKPMLKWINWGNIAANGQAAALICGLRLTPKVSDSAEMPSQDSAPATPTLDSAQLCGANRTNEQDQSNSTTRVEVASDPTLVASKDNGEDKELTDKQKEKADYKRFCSQIGELLAYINHRMSVEFEVGLTEAERGPAARMLKTWLKDFTPREVALAIEYAYNDTEDRNLKRAREKATNLLSVYVFKPLLVDAYNDESPTLQRELKWMTWSE